MMTEVTPPQKKDVDDDRNDDSYERINQSIGGITISTLIVSSLLTCSSLGLPLLASLLELVHLLPFK